jgi:hypothetical protein
MNGNENLMKNLMPTLQSQNSSQTEKAGAVGSTGAKSNIEGGFSNEIIAEAKLKSKSRRFSHTAHISQDVVESIERIAKKAELSKSEVTEQLLRKALGL